MSTSRRFQLAKMRSTIDQAKTKMQDADAFTASRRAMIGDPMSRIFRAYEDHLRVANAVDFNDLLNLTVRMFEQHPDVLAQYQDRFRYVMVDEYQDTNLAQYKLVKLLAGGHRNLAVVGDDDQSIYAFRGADIRNILDFERDFSDATTIRLERNYRSTSPILKAAHAVVSNNRGRMEKELWTDRDVGEKVQLMIARDDAEEAHRVLRQIQKPVTKAIATVTLPSSIAPMRPRDPSSRRLCRGRESRTSSWGQRSSTSVERFDITRRLPAPHPEPDRQHGLQSGHQRAREGNRCGGALRDQDGGRQ